MASKPTVTLTFDGDETKLTDAFERVGAASKQMSSEVGAASKSGVDSVGASTDVMVEKADGAESKFIGFTDTISGVQGALEGLSDPTLTAGERMAILGQAGADMAGGFANLVIPALGRFGSAIAATTAGTWAMTTAKAAWGSVTSGVTVAMGALNAVMRANPIMTVITIVGLLVAGFLLLWNKSEGFRNFFIGMWNAIKDVVGSVVTWIKNVWNGIPAFFTGIATTISNVFSGIGNAIKNAFRSALNFVIDLLNGAIWAINKLISGINAVPGVDIPHIPKIPKLHTGGRVPGLPGQEVLAVLQGGEHVSTSSQGGGGGATITFAGDVDSAFASAFMMLQQRGDIIITA